MIRAMKILTTFALILLAGCAAAPPAADPKTIESDAAPEAAHASSQTAADRQFAEATRGYNQVERNGEMFYCRMERASGSNLRTQNCFTEAELRTRVENAENYRRCRKASGCASTD